MYDGWTTEPAYTISSPGAFGSGELKMLFKAITVELQWLEHLWDYENLFETGVVRAIDGLL